MARTPWPPCAIPALVAGCSLLRPAYLEAQALSGRVVSEATRQPLSGVVIVLLAATPNDSVRSAAKTTAPSALASAPPERPSMPGDTIALATGVTDADGVFLLTAPTPGTYRVRIGTNFLTQPVTLVTVESFEEREYRLVAASAPTASAVAPPGSVPSAGAVSPPGPRACSKEALQALLMDSAGGGSGPTSCEFQIEKTASAIPGTLRARYPDELRDADGVRTSGYVVTQFVVDERGLADMASFGILEVSDPAFIAPAWEAISHARFTPAEVGHRKVRQLVQLPFTFSLAAVRRLDRRVGRP